MPPVPLKIDTAPGALEGILIMRLSGSLTLGDLPKLQAAAKASTEALVVLDMSGVPYVDSAGLGAIMNFHLAAQKQGRRLAVAAPQQRIAALMELTKVNTVLKVYPTIADAESTL
ncbi:STAS domain-containing protein [Terriglobus albidus]|uniref:STAS domain-containing protein n=1 Tax=Terriglobus albidus TaxID=1592106 RepID=UPI0021DFAE78|nr:STAS domain-containing protein [Terriglobus albidus]